MEDNKDVEALYDELRSALAKDSEEEESSGASAQEPAPDAEPVVPVDENAEFSEEEISKLTPRAQKRIRDLAEQVKELADKPAVETPEDSPEETQTARSFKNVEEFLSAVEDEPSRKLLETFAKVMKGEIAQTLSPIEEANNKARFETEFTKYHGIEGLDAHKDEIRKTYMRNPSTSIKSLVGDVVTDLQLNRIKPIVSGESAPNREGKIDTESMTLEELYAALDTTKG